MRQLFLFMFITACNNIYKNTNIHTYLMLQINLLYINQMEILHNIPISKIKKNNHIARYFLFTHFVIRFLKLVLNK